MRREPIDGGNPMPRLNNAIQGLVTVVALAMVAFQMAVAKGWLLLDSVTLNNNHLGFIIVLLSLVGVSTARNAYQVVMSGLCLLLGLTGVVYVGWNLQHLQMIMGFPETTDVIIGVMLIAVVLDLTWRSWGMTLPIVAGLFIVYFLLGQYLVGSFHHRAFDFGYVVSYLSVGLTGIYGNLLSISANQIFLFVVFGSLFEILGIQAFLTEAGKLVGRRMRSGPGQTAVISSSLVSMITGASVANVAVTGAFTIPYMKQAGYSAESAGGVEATASTGGQLMPPVMGAAAFLMAFFIGIPYVDVMLVGIIPAALFYFGVMFAVHFASVREGVNAHTDRPDYGVLLRSGPAFVVPVSVIVTLLMMSYTPSVAAFWAICTGIVLSQIGSERADVSQIVACLARGATVGAKIGVILALVGMISQTMITTGIGAKLTGVVEVLSYGNVYLALIITMFISIVLGLGVPPAAAYSLVAMTAAPVLIHMDVPVLAAHFFVFYFAIVSAVTPPVALGALAATGLSGGNYFATSIKAFKLALSGFIIPYFFVFNPILLLEVNDWYLAVGAAISMPIALIALSAFIYGAGFRLLRPHERALAFLVCVAAFGYTILLEGNYLVAAYCSLAASLIGFAILATNQWTTRRMGSAALREPVSGN